jgi:hypothetical protein
MRTVVRQSLAAPDGAAGGGMITAGPGRRGSYMAKLAAILATTYHPSSYLTSQRPASAALPFAP